MIKKVVLIQKETILHYRVSIYNHFSRVFPNYGYDLTVIAERTQQDSPYPIEFNFIQKKITFGTIIKQLNKITPDAVIIFLGLRNLLIWPLLIYGKTRKLPILTWGHAIDLSQPKNVLKNKLYSFVDILAKGIILYSSEDIKYIPKRQRNKVFVANNTLNFNDFPEIAKSKEQIKKKWNISFAKTVLFSGRIHPRKKLDVLVELFCMDEFLNFGLIIVGPGIPRDLREKVENRKNIFYLGPVYDFYKINEIFKMADIFCIPGAVGLSINQAFYWGLPIVTQIAHHGPEICYLKNEKNGYIAEDQEEFKYRILSLLTDDSLCGNLSENAKKTILTEGNIEHMTAGFVDALEAST